MLMLSHVIVAHEIGGYTESTFQVAVQGYEMELLAFTKFVLRNFGNSHFFVGLALWCARAVTNIASGKASNVHRKDMQSALIMLYNAIYQASRSREQSADCCVEQHWHKRFV
jgi:hypothetical protein